MCKCFSVSYNLYVNVSYFRPLPFTVTHDPAVHAGVPSPSMAVHTGHSCQSIPSHACGPPIIGALHGIGLVPTGFTINLRLQMFSIY